MADIKGLPASLSPSSSDTDSLNAPSSAASPAISPVNQSFSSPSSASAELKSDGGCAHIHGTDSHAEEGRCSVSSNMDEEMVRQRVGDTDAALEQQTWDASPIHQGENLEQASQGADANSRCGSEDSNAGQMATDMYADAEKALAFSNVKQVDGAEEGQGECCRVCHLSPGKITRAGEFMKLGCACKDDLALAHRHCAETWFKIKGNRTCEICGSTAQNILLNGRADHGDQWNDVEANNPVFRRAERCWQNQPICNTVLVLNITSFCIGGTAYPAMYGWGTGDCQPLELWENEPISHRVSGWYWPGTASPWSCGKRAHFLGLNQIVLYHYSAHVSVKGW